MRDTLIIVIVVLGCCAALRRPWIGMMLWTWLSIMNPHRYTWEASALPLAMATALCTFAGMVFNNKELRSPFYGAAPVTLALFMLWVSITYPFSFDVFLSNEMLTKVLKIDMMILAAIMVIQTRKQIIAFTWLVTFCIAFYGIKGGVFTLTTGGVDRVWGPAFSFIEGNNEIGLAVIVVIPLLVFLRGLLQKAWQRHAMVLAMVFCTAATLGTQSRGALLAIAAMAVVLWWRSSTKVVTGMAIVIAGTALVAFMPDEWMNRMHTIRTYEEDESAMGRLNAWSMAWNLAKDRLFGGGFAIYSQQVFSLYAPDPLDVRAAHSIYFQVMGEQGFFGLALYLLMWVFTWRIAGWLRVHGARNEASRWTVSLGAMCQVSMAGFFVGGAFLSLAYFDLPLNIMIILTAAKRWVQEEGWLREPAASVTAQPATAPPRIGTA